MMESFWKSVIRRAGLSAVAAAMLVSVGCVTTQSQVRSRPPCSGCACEQCASALAAAQGDSDPATSVGQSDLPGTSEFDSSTVTTEAAAEPLPVPPLPVPPESAPEDIPPRQLVMPAPPARDMEARQECAQLHQQTQALQAQLESLQAHLKQEELKQQALKHSLTSVNTRVGALSSELQYWKQEVKRIDQEAEQQHREDLQSLQTISELISRLPRPATASGVGGARQ